MLARKFTKQFIWITGILNVVLCLGTAIYYIIRKNYGTGIPLLILAAFSAYCFYTWIPRIPFSVLMLQTATDVAKYHGHVYMVSLVGGLIGAVFMVLLCVTLAAIYITYDPSGGNPACKNGAGGCSRGKAIGLIAFAIFAGYCTFGLHWRDSESEYR